MADAAKNGPVKAVDEGFMFVIEKGANLWEALYAWKEQACKPWLEKSFSPDFLAGILKNSADETKTDTSGHAFQEAAITELLVEKYPEHVDKITMLQLLNVAINAKYNTDISEKILKEFNKSAERFAKGEETFPPTLQNIATLNEHRDFIDDYLLAGKFSYDAYQGGTLKEDFDKRVAEAELKMLKELKPEDLEFVSDRLISAGSKIAAKHKDAGDFENLFVKEIKSRLAQGKIFDPRDPND